jgi:hypothetical protein
MKTSKSLLTSTKILNSTFRKPKGINLSITKIEMEKKIMVSPQDPKALFNTLKVFIN